MVNIDPDKAFAETLSDTALEERIEDQDRALRWRPRDRSKAVGRWERRLAAVEGKRTALDARLAECSYKAHRYRFVPWIGKSWANRREQAKADLEAAKAEAKWVRFKLEKARLACEKRKAWEQVFGPEISEREALRQERSRRQAAFGERRLSEMRSRGAEVPGTGSEAARRWATLHGRREWSAHLREQRREQEMREQRERGC